MYLANLSSPPYKYKISIISGRGKATPSKRSTNNGHPEDASIRRRNSGRQREGCRGHGCMTGRSERVVGVTRECASLSCENYLFCICWVIWALCSWKRSLTRCWVAIHLRTQRLMQPVSRVARAFEVKSSTQLTKQCSTSPPKA